MGVHGHAAYTKHTNDFRHASCSLPMCSLASRSTLQSSIRVARVFEREIATHHLFVRFPCLLLLSNLARLALQSIMSCTRLLVLVFTVVSGRPFNGQVRFENVAVHMEGEKAQAAEHVSKCWYVFAFSWPPYVHSTSLCQPPFDWTFLGVAGS